MYANKYFVKKMEYLQMKKYFLLFIFIFQVSAFAGNKFLDVNPANCKKINGTGDLEAQAIASFYKVSMSSVRFIKATWGPGQYGLEQCNMIFDTEKGPKQCHTFYILTDDDGKTAFGLAVPQSGNYPVCF
jgi:hypothetical protein